ncbi:hypothetical protein DQ04_04071090, partial [Trypanosoma grayi]|uniref:hypothetical protein n=1 Tax=Trypanosoma grayi TaxID=71804 RepID=UPI0004F4439C
MMSSRAMAQLQRERDFMRTADIVNKFIISTAQFLNRFAAQCDNKLLETSRSLQRLEALTVLLESKLNSIDEEYGEERDAMTAAPPPTAALVSGSLAPPAFADRNAPPPMPGLVAVQSINRPPPPPPQRHGPP